MAGIESYRVQYAKPADQVANSAQVAFQQGSNRSKNPTDPEVKIQDGKSSADNAPLKFPSDLSSDFYISFDAFKFSQDRPEEARRSFQFQRTINLPLPASINDQFGASYEQGNLFFGGEALRSEFNNMMQSSDGTRRAKNVFTNEALNKLATSVARAADTVRDRPGDVAAAGLTYLMQGVGGPIGYAARSAFQVSTNPYPVMVYSGTRMKSFSFSWVFYPETKEETDIIKKIVGFFRREMLPEQVDNIPSILKSPAIFEVKIKPDEYMMKFKRCVVSDLSVNYAPSGPSFVKTSDSTAAPAAVSMSLTLNEIELWTADDFSSTEEKNFDYVDK